MRWWVRCGVLATRLGGCLGGILHSVSAVGVAERYTRSAMCAVGAAQSGVGACSALQCDVVGVAVGAEVCSSM